VPAASMSVTGSGAEVVAEAAAGTAGASPALTDSLAAVGRVGVGSAPLTSWVSGGVGGALPLMVPTGWVTIWRIWRQRIASRKGAISGKVGIGVQVVSHWASIWLAHSNYAIEHPDPSKVVADNCW
jgi:hypothetical protein